MLPPSNIPPPPPETTPQERLDALRRKADQADGLLNAASEPASPPAPTLPATVSAPTPIPDQPGASPGQKVWMGLGLALLTGLGTLPLLLMLWVVGATLGIVVTAEALERTRGLAPSTYGGAFWLACAFIVLLVVLELVTRFTPRPEGQRPRGCLAALLTRPLVAVLLLFLPCVLLVRCDLGGTDVPDIITTTALLCVLGYGLFVLPIAFLALAIRLARWLWRVGQRSGFRSGLVAGVGMVVGALLPTCLVCAPPEFVARVEGIHVLVEDGVEQIADEVDRKGTVDGSLAALTIAATQIPGTMGPWKPSPLDPQLDSRLRTCVARFTAASRRVATVEEATRFLISRYRTDRDTANAIAYGTVFAVCRRHARAAVTGDLDQYFWRSVKNNYCKDLGRNALAQCSSFDTLDARCDGLPSVSGEQLDAAVDLRARLCRLDEENRAIVLRDFEGDTSEQIAAARGLSAATVRKRLERAYKKMAPN
jgi:DNA-directed RNA polymerase specialized sigma24 family protein